jgi:nitric oxide reductase subunit B
VVLLRARAAHPREFEWPDGETVVTAEQVRAGKVQFQRNGLMNPGSILGNGTYYGVDYTADALDLKVEAMRDYYARERYGDDYAALPGPEQAAVDDRVESDLASTDTTSPVQLSAAEAYAHERAPVDEGVLADD